MSDHNGSGITVSGGGSTTVETEGLARRMKRLRSVAAELDHATGRLSSRERLGHYSGAPPSAVAADHELDGTVSLLHRVDHRVDTLATGLDTAAQRYGTTEGALDRMAQSLGGDVGYLVGALLPASLLSVLPFALAAGTLGYSVWSLTPETVRESILHDLPGWLQQHSSVLTDPATVEFIRLLVMSLDDIGGGTVGIPLELSYLLGDDGLGLLGVTSSAGIVLAAGRPLGAFREAPLEVNRSGAATTVTPPTTFVERVDRIPTGAAQVRIDRFPQENGPDRFEVYISGTQDFSLIAGDQPFDMTSNIEGVAGEPTASTTSVQQAMADAGIDSSTPVVFTGHSQGGLIAATLAASGDYDTQGLFTIGAPAARIDVPASVPWVAVEHTDDLVPALGGTWDNGAPVIVRREVFDGVPVDNSIPFPAHQRPSYRATAVLMDDSVEPRITSSLAAFDAADGSAASGEAQLYQAIRLTP